MMLKTWVLVVLINGTYIDQTKSLTYNQCMDEMKKYTFNNPETKYNVRCEWRDIK